jgi:hypothetical protein
MMTMQTPQTTWNPAAPTAGVNGHSTRIADVIGGVTPTGFPIGAIPTQWVNPFYAHDLGAMNPYAAFPTPVTMNPYALNPLALNPFAAINPFACACPTNAFGSFVNPFVPTFHAIPNVWQSPLAVNPFATINPYVAQTLAQQTLATLPHVAPTINPFVNPVTAPISGYVNPLATNPVTATFNPFVAPIQPTVTPTAAVGTIGGTTVNPAAVPANVLTNPITASLTGIPHPAIMNPYLTNHLMQTLNSIPTTTPYFQGIHPAWSGGAFPGVFGQGVSVFPYEPFLANGVAWHPYQQLARSTCGIPSALQTINPFVTNPIATNPYLTNPYLANPIAAATGLNPFVRPGTNNPYGWACGLNPFGTTLGVC